MDGRVCPHDAHMDTETTTRFPAHTPETASGRAAELLAELWNRHEGALGSMVRTMAGSPALLSGYLDLSRAMKRSKLSRTDAERVSIAVQALLGCRTCLDAHIAAGRDAGLDDTDVQLAQLGTAIATKSAELIDYALAVHENPASIDSDTLTSLRSHGYSDRELLDVIGLVTLNHLTGAVNLVAGLHTEES